MAHDRKKSGQRKDKKTARMREDVERRREAEVERPTTDQKDLVPFKSGGPSDRAVQPSTRHGVQDR